VSGNGHGEASGAVGLDQLEALVERAVKAGADEAEAYGERSVSRRIKVYGGAVEELTQAGRKGLGLRVRRDGAVGYAYSSDLSPDALDGLVRRALDHAAVADPDEDAEFAEPSDAYPDVQVFDPHLDDLPIEAKIDLAKAAERAALEYDPRVKLVEDTIYADGDATVSLVSSRGVRGTYREDDSYIFLYVLAEQDHAVETGIAYAVGRDPSRLDAAACGREAAERATRLLGAQPCPSFKGTAVLEPYVAASVLGVLGAALTADAVQKGRSLFASLEGQQVAAPLLSLSDDGVHPDGLASAPFDGEGTPCRHTPVIAAGVLQGFLYDVRTAHRAGRASTGNGLRGSYQAVPSVRPTNLIVEGPSTTAADIVAGIEHGVLVTDAVGVHSGANPVSGEFSVGISGILIESGRLTRPLREVTLAGDILSILKGVVALGDDARWVPAGSVLVPTVAVEGMSVAGS
jgi:PmbA protein